MASFADGTLTQIQRGRPLADSPCSCGARGHCRHRLAAVLAYRQQPPPPPPAPTLPDDAALSAYLGKTLMQKAHRQKGKQRIQIVTDKHLDLETCNVHFLSDYNLEFARCDCAARGKCEHLALAIWALRSPPTASIELPQQGIQQALQILQDILASGVSQIGSGLKARFPEALRQLNHDKQTWPALLLQDIAEQLDAYANASSRYRRERVAWCAASLWARWRTAQTDSAQAAAALGIGLAPETQLRQSRLTGLGCRLDKHGARYYFADDSGVVLELPNPRGFDPHKLACGVLISASLHRRANGRLRLGRGQHSLSPLQASDWQTLTRLHGPPPPGDLLGPLNPQIRLLPIATPPSGGYSPSHQEISLWTHYEHVPIRIALTHRQAAPHALEALWENASALTWVAGTMEREGAHWRLSPTALLTPQQAIAPDLASQGTLHDAPLIDIEIASDPLNHTLEQALSACAEVYHRGLSHLDKVRATLVPQLEKIGLQRSAQAFRDARSGEDCLALTVRMLCARELNATQDAPPPTRTLPDG